MFWKSKNTKKGKVFVGLSGGVDSAVAAALLVSQGYDVTGVFIRIAIDGYPCTAAQDKLDAMRVAAHLRAPFKELDLSREYRKRIFEFSISEFAKGRTPNPDALCNREIKFGLFFDWCMSHGADFVATGHYARIKTTELTTELLTGADPNKDQSYFLWAVSETTLRKTLFPIGHLQKPEVRALALRFGLPNAARKDSQGLCFLGPVSMDDLLRRELALVPGKVLNAAGEEVGAHEGVQAYTLGQRHGFVLRAQGPDMPPHFVVAKDVGRNTITVSTKKIPDTASTAIHLAEVNWIGPVEDGPCTARFRYRQKLIPAVLSRSDLRLGAGLTCAEVTLFAPQYAPLGQSLVLYRGDRCLGGGVIDTVDN